MSDQPATTPTRSVPLEPAVIPVPEVPAEPLPEIDPLQQALIDILTVIDVAVRSMEAEAHRVDVLYGHSHSRQNKVLRAQYTFALQGLVLIRNKTTAIVQQYLLKPKGVPVTQGEVQKPE